jgi:hypothetical protein
MEILSFTCWVVVNNRENIHMVPLSEHRCVLVPGSSWVTAPRFDGINVGFLLGLGRVRNKNAGTTQIYQVIKGEG